MLSRLLLVACVACLATTASPAAPGTTQPEPVFRAERIADGVFLLRPAGDAGDRTNSLVVSRDDGWLVVAAQPTQAAARELIAAVHAIDPAPIRYLVLPHPHAEAAAGAAAFPADTLVIAAARGAEALEDPAYDFAAERTVPEAGGDVQAPARPTPTLLLAGRTRLADGRNPVDLLPVYRAHSIGDLLVELPGSGVMFLGAVLAPDRNPWAGDASVEGWLGLLNHLIKNGPGRYLPLRGAPAERRDLQLQRDAFAWLRGQVELAFVEQVPSEEMAAWVLEQSDFGARFDADARPSFLPGLVEVAVEEALLDRRKRGRRP